MPHGTKIFKAGDTDLGQFPDLGLLRRWQWLEQAVGPAVALPTEFPDGYHVPQHRHSRS